jgi:hypothetical protein
VINDTAPRNAGQSQKTSTRSRSRLWVTGTRRPTLAKFPKAKRAKRKKYTRHRNRPTIIPAERLPQALRWIACLLPFPILHTYEVLLLLSQGGQVSPSIAEISARRGLCERGVRYHIAVLEGLQILRVVENRIWYDYNAPNTFIFLEIDPFAFTLTFANCRDKQFVFNTRTTSTFSREKSPVKRRAKTKAEEVSDFRRKWDADHAKNHPYAVRRAWYERRKARRQQNYSAELRQAYQARANEWNRVDEWRKAHPNHELAERLRREARARIGTYDQAAAAASEAIYQAKRAAMTPEELAAAEAAEAAEAVELEAWRAQERAKRAAAAADAEQRKRDNAAAAAARRAEYDQWKAGEPARIQTAEKAKRERLELMTYGLRRRR